MSQRVIDDHVEVAHHIHRVEPPPKQNLLNELKNGLKETFFSDEPLRHFKDKSAPAKLFLVLQGVFPILDWGRSYTLAKFKGDLIAGLTIASLCVPQVKDFLQGGNNVNNFFFPNF
jgi:high affinity sulfate transporter 1